VATQSAWQGMQPSLAASKGDGDPLRFGGGDGDDGQTVAGQDLAVMGAWIISVPVFMLFLAFASAYVFRKGLGADWLPVALPGVLWLNTAVLLASSCLLELGRRRSQASWVAASALLGTGFLVGQVFAWSQLQAAGVALDSTPHSSFVYLFTGMHALHVILGVALLAAAALWPTGGWLRTSKTNAVGASAVYWHFMGVLWVGIFLLINFGR
jgi:cytochrome c oxidase subunit 3